MPIRPTEGAEEDEELDDLDLPPLDTDEGDEPPPDEAGELPGDALERGGLDDATAADLDVGDELDDLDDEAGADADADVDVGPLEEGIDVAEQDGDAGEEDATVVDAEGVAVDETHDADDGGAEGTSENPEDEVDEGALPDIDDGEDAVGEQALADALFAEGRPDLPEWASVRVAPVEGAGAAVPCRSIAVAAGRVAAAGEVLLFVEEGARAARRLPFGEGVIAVALGDDALLAATARGQLLAGRLGDAGSRAAGADATSLGTFRAGAGASSPVQLAATPGRFWIRAQGSLSCATLTSPATLWRDAGVLAIAASAGALIAVTLGATGPVIERVRGDDEGGMEAPLTGPARALVERSRDTLRFAATAGGRCLALGEGRDVAISRDTGATFTLLHLGAVAALAFAGEGTDAPLLALVTADPRREGDDDGARTRGPAGAPSAPPPPTASWAFLVEIAAAGEPACLGELAGTERDLPAAIAWDPSRELYWVASGAGLVALGMPRRH
jgi:hypothetical protein